MSAIKTHIIVLLIGFILGLGLMYQCNNPTHEIRYVKYEKIDTVYYSVIIPPDTIYIKTKGKVVFEAVVKDSLIICSDTINALDYLLNDSMEFPAKLMGVNLWASPPFVSSLDTIIDGNKYKLGFRYPELVQEFELFEKPDTLMNKEITKYIFIEKPVPWFDEWWMRVLTHSAALGLGAYLAK